MTLRSRLILTFTTVVVLVTFLLGALAIRTTSRVLTEQVEDRIRSVTAADIFPVLEAEEGPTGRSLALLVFDRRGQIMRSIPSGLPGNPDPLPAITNVEQLPADPGQVFSVDAVTGTNGYRAMAVPGRAGRTFVIAHILNDVASAQAALIRRLFFGGGLVLLAGVAAIWVIVSRGMRPVDDMIGAAEAIAAGDLSRRIPEADPGSELGRLGASFNHMMTGIETAFAAETKANSRLKQFVADASHELRTPLSAIAGYTDLLAMGALEESETRRRAIERMQSETRRMGRLIEDLLLLARFDLAAVEPAGQPLDLHRVDMTEVIRDAVADHHAIDPERHVEVDATGPVYVLGDAERLTQVWANLLSNLRDHTPDGTTARISMTASDGRVQATYHDEGPGFDPESLDRVFDRFRRADPSRSRQSGGTGLGLAIVAAIVDAHGGTITAVPSEGGTTITVELMTDLSATSQPAHRDLTEPSHILEPNADSEE